MKTAGARQSATILMMLGAGASVAQRIAALLASSPIDTVSRAELRRDLPTGRPRLMPIGRAARREGTDTGSSVGNNLSHALRGALADFERRGLIVRVGGDVRVLDRAGLRQVAGLEVAT